jgi:hypothetical protein
MENWQLALIILAAVLVGAAIPVFIMACRAFYRAGKEISQIGERLMNLLSSAEIITDRFEVMTRGIKEGETDIADLIKSAGNLSRGINRNMKIINIFSTFLLSAGAAVTGFIKNKIPPEEATEPVNDTEK